MWVFSIHSSLLFIPPHCNPHHSKKETKHNHLAMSLPFLVFILSFLSTLHLSLQTSLLAPVFKDHSTRQYTLQESVWWEWYVHRINLLGLGVLVWDEEGVFIVYSLLYSFEVWTDSLLCFFWTSLVTQSWKEMPQKLKFVSDPRVQPNWSTAFADILKWLV